MREGQLLIHNDRVGMIFIPRIIERGKREMFALEKTKRIIGIILIMSMLLTALGTLGGNGISTESSGHKVQDTSTIRFTHDYADLAEHDPILITHDDNFTQLGFTGSGIEGDPYLIEDLEIRQDEGLSNCIEIEDTTVHFKISGCLLYGYDFWAPIQLNNLSNANIVGNHLIRGVSSIDCNDVYDSIIEDNLCEDADDGIVLNLCGRNQVNGNTISSYVDAIRLDTGMENNVTENLCQDFGQIGIKLTLGWRNRVQGNTIEGGKKGVWIESSDNNTIIENDMFSCGLSINYAHYIQYRIENNTVNGRPSFYAYNESSVSVPSDAGEVLLIDCNDTVIDGLWINDTTGGIELFNCINMTISDNTILNSHDNAIDITDCTGMTIARNHLEGGFMGVNIEGASLGAVIENNYAKDFHTPLYLLSSHVTATWNTLYGNHRDATVFGSDSTFDYNFYSRYTGTDQHGDGIGDTPFLLDGHAEVEDDHPLVFEAAPPLWSINDTYIHEYGNFFEVPLEIVSDAPIVEMNFSDNTFFELTEEALRERMRLPKGNYSLHIAIENIYGAVVESNVTITVMDSTPPTMIVSQTIHWELGTDLSVDLDSFDESGIDSIEMHQYNYLQAFEVNSLGFVVSRTHLYIGEYRVDVTVTDNCGYSTSIELTINVRDTMAPSILGSDVRYDVGVVGNILVFNVNDFDPENFSLTYDIAGISSNISGQWEGENLTFSVDGLESGTYSYTLTVFDKSGNSATRTARVYVRDPVMVFVFSWVLPLTVYVGIVSIIVLLVVMLRRKGGQ